MEGWVGHPPGDRSVMDDSFSIATWNINGIRARLDLVAMWLARHEPDIVLLQETKVEDQLFPRVPFLELGYEVVHHGSKGRAGVATLSKKPVAETYLGFRDGPTDQHCRILNTLIDGVRVYNLYVPNGQSLGTEAFQHKLQWLERLCDELGRHHDADAPLVLAGDFNIAPDDRDVHDPAAMRGHIHFSEPEHAALAQLQEFGLRDCFRKHCSEAGHYSWFDYRSNAFARGLGLRIDLVLASRPMYDRCTSAIMDHEPRGWDGPSDHVPVVVRFRR